MTAQSSLSSARRNACGLRRSRRLTLQWNSVLTWRDSPTSWFQAYKAIRDYRAGQYPGQPWRSDVPTYPLVLTLEEWFTFGDFIVAELDGRVRERLIAAGLSVGWIEEMPYSVCSAQDFERLVQVIAKRGVQNVLKTKARDPEHRKWIFDSVLREHFSTDVRATVDLFPEIFDQILPGLGGGPQKDWA